MATNSSTQEPTQPAAGVSRNAPMPSAPMVYNEEGTVAWENMWDTFCVLASAGGPPHRADLLAPPANVDPDDLAYQAVAAEIVRNIHLVSALPAYPAQPGWIAIECENAAHAQWISEEIRQENVASCADGTHCLVPVGAAFTMEKEIKNVITVVAKTTHCWRIRFPIVQ